MRIAYVVVLPLLLLGACASTGMGPHAHGALDEAMHECPMASAQHDDARQGESPDAPAMGHDQMQGRMGQGAMANCPMMQPSAPEASVPEPHQH
jgi:hypothetical protein